MAVTSLQQVTSFLYLIFSLIYIEAFNLYILSSVVICNYAIEIGRSMAPPKTWCQSQSQRCRMRVYSQIRDVEVYQFWGNIIK